MTVHQELESIKELLDNQSEEHDGEFYIPHEAENRFFALCFNNAAEIKTPENIELTKYINNKIYYVLTNVIVDGKQGIVVGKTTYNAAVDEINIHETYGWQFGGLGDLDHYYHHTGKGFPGTDFVLDKSFTVNVFNKETKLIEPIVLPVGCKIDAKTYISCSNAETYIKANTDGSLGHFGDKLIIHIIGTHDYYLADNTADAELMKLEKFNPVRKYSQYGITEANDGMLKVYRCWER